MTPTTALARAEDEGQGPTTEEESSMMNLVDGYGIFQKEDDPEYMRRTPSWWQRLAELLRRRRKKAA